MTVLYGPDSFIGADGDPIATWTTSVDTGGSAVYDTNRARLRSNGTPFSYAALVLTPSGSPANITMSGVFTTPGTLADNTGSVWVRGVDVNGPGQSGYIGGWDILGNTINIAKHVSNTYTLLVSTAFTFVASTTYYWRIETQGTAVRFYLDDVPFVATFSLTTTDGSNTAGGDVALFSFTLTAADSDLFFDDVTVEDFATPSTSVRRGIAGGVKVFLRKYGVGSGADIYVPVLKAGSNDEATSSDWTPAAGDVKVSKDGAAAANIGTLPVAVTMGNGAMWKFVFTNAELTAKTLSVNIADSATKAVQDDYFVVETVGDASARLAFDSTSSTVTVGAVGANTLTASALAADAVAEIGTYLQKEFGTAQAGASGTITLAAGASATNSYYSGRAATVFIRGGTGVGQERSITAYVGSTKVATVDRNWAVTPDSTSVYIITFA